MLSNNFVFYILNKSYSDYFIHLSFVILGLAVLDEQDHEVKGNSKLYMCIKPQNTSPSYVTMPSLQFLV